MLSLNFCFRLTLSIAKFPDIESKSMPFHAPKVLYENIKQNIYCNQEYFSILICGGKNKNGKTANKVLELEVPSFKMKNLIQLFNHIAT